MNGRQVKELAVAASLGYLTYRYIEMRRVVNKLIRIHNQRVFDEKFDGIVENYGQY